MKLLNENENWRLIAWELENLKDLSRKERRFPIYLLMSVLIRLSVKSEVEVSKPDVIDKSDSELASGFYLVRNSSGKLDLYSFSSNGTWNLVLDNLTNFD